MCGGGGSFNPIDPRTYFPGTKEVGDAATKELKKLIPKPAVMPTPAGPAAAAPGETEAQAAAKSLQARTAKRRRATSLLASGAAGDPSALTATLPGAQAGKTALGQ